MGIVFFCMSCGARFEVDPRMAGKKGNCKKCGQQMQIPRAEQVASMAAMPALTPGRVAAPAGAAIGDPLEGWLRSAASDVGLAPISVDQMKAVPRKKAPQTPLDDAEDSKPYLLAEPRKAAVPRPKSSGRPNVALRLWRGQLGGVQKIFRKLNEFAYLVTVPFLMLLLLGTALHHRPLALFSATVVVLLSLGRIASGVVNLVVVPLRDGLNTRKMKKPFRRVAEPALTIVLVVLAFTFIPWLRTGEEPGGPLAERLRSSARELRQEMKGEIKGTVRKVEQLDVDQLGKEARQKLETLGTGEGARP